MHRPCPWYQALYKSKFPSEGALAKHATAAPPDFLLDIDVMTQLDPHFRAAQTSLHVLKGRASMLHSSLAAYLTVSRSFVCRYLLNGDNFYVVVEGGSRLLFNPANKTTLPCTFGLAAVEDALVVQVDNAVRCWNTLNSCL